MYHKKSPTTIKKEWREYYFTIAITPLSPACVHLTMDTMTIIGSTLLALLVTSVPLGLS
jgi:hypothetical protein